MTGDHDAVLASALVEEACRKSSLVWLRAPGSAHPLAVWHAFVDGAVHVVGGGLEQHLPDLPDGGMVDVTVRSKDTGGRLLRYPATVTRLTPGTEAWDGAVRELHAKRLNAPDGEAAPQRWARECTILRLDVAGPPAEAPGHPSHRSHAAEPAGSPATTRGPLPFVLGRRARRRR